MNGFSISITAPDTKKYPLHKHSHWEVMYYLSGKGELATRGKGIPFEKGTIIIVPPDTEHGSVSNKDFVNISVGGAFDNLLMADGIITIKDNQSFDGEQLAKLIYKNRHLNNEYLSSLCLAYVNFILQNHSYEKRVHRTVEKIIKEISENYYNPEFDVTQVLNQSAYAEDYIRSEFTKITKLSPVQFLAKIRIEHAQKLFEIYGDSLSVSEVAFLCGFNDTVYFSRRFKEYKGISPSAYKKNKC